MADAGLKVIRVKLSTWEGLARIKRTGESWEELLRRLLDRELELQHVRRSNLVGGALRSGHDVPRERRT